MNNRLLRENLLLGATIVVFGVMAGFFWTYTFNVNRAMLQVDGATYAEVQSLFNINVRHPMFFSFFFGGGLISILALLGNIRLWKTKSFGLMTLATLIYIAGVIVFTAMVNLPLNDYTESWDPTSLPNDWSNVRSQWSEANAVRVATSGSAFILATLALVLRAMPTTSVNRNE